MTIRAGGGAAGRRGRRSPSNWRLSTAAPAKSSRSDLPVHDLRAEHDEREPAAGVRRAAHEVEAARRAREVARALQRPEAPVWSAGVDRAAGCAGLALQVGWRSLRAVGDRGLEAA